MFGRERIGLSRVSWVLGWHCIRVRGNCRSTKEANKTNDTTLLENSAHKKFMSTNDILTYHRLGRLYGAAYKSAVEATEETGTEDKIAGARLAGRVAPVHCHPDTDR